MRPPISIYRQLDKRDNALSRWSEVLLFVSDLAHTEMSSKGTGPSKVPSVSAAIRSQEVVQIYPAQGDIEQTELTAVSE